MKSIEGEDDKKLASGGKEIATPETIWTTVRDTNKSAPDAYKEAGNPAFISEFGSNVKEGISLITNLVKGGKQASSLISDVLNKASQVKSLEGILDLLESSGSPAIDLLKKHGVNIDSDILKHVGNLKRLTIAVDNVYKAIRATDFKDVNTLLSIAGELTGNDSFYKLSDAYTQAQLSLGIIKSLIKEEIPNSITLFKPLLQDNPYKVMVVKESITLMGQYNDLASIQASHELLGDNVFKSVMTTYDYRSNLANVLLKDWNEAHEPLELPKEKIYPTVVETLVKVMGKDFLYLNRGNTKTLNLAGFSFISPRLKSLFLTSASSDNQIKPLTAQDVNKEITQELASNLKTRQDDRKFLVMLSMLEPISVIEAIQRDFKRLYISQNQIVL